MLSRSRNAVVASALALLPLPAMKLLDHLNRGCGDGLCGFFSGLLILGGLAVATVVFLVRSARRGETPAVMRFVPLALWVAALAPLFR
ncbi:MAG: hypothetical protein KDJ41_20755 [Hyphomicrobiaceae bacterium]|nr:hypothetical protein [Hyphomicrobiaceae bacterium]